MLWSKLKQSCVVQTDWPVQSSEATKRRLQYALGTSRLDFFTRQVSLAGRFLKSAQPCPTAASLLSLLLLLLLLLL